MRIAWLAILLILASAGGASGANQQKVRLALVVGTNRAPKPALPNLRYADDDAIRWALLLESTGAKVALLTDPDPESQRLYGSATPRHRAPTPDALDAAVAELAQARAEAHARGAETVFTFVYAGHGDVEAGRGFVTLEGGRMFRDDLETRVLAKLAADVNHVVVDACRSYYFIYDRGPNGAGEHATRERSEGYFAAGVAQRFRNTGFLLSSSSGGASHEWEDFQSGVFSHELRSGLLGAADADRDGLVTYRELGAFLQVANHPIRNERYRPAFLVRPPLVGDDTFLDLTQAQGGRLDLPAGFGRRLVVEDGMGVRWIDMHPGIALPLTVYLPTVGWSDRFFLREHNGDREYAMNAGAVVSLADLTPGRARHIPRGAAHEAFASLFSEPFDAAALAATPKGELRSFAADDLAAFVEPTQLTLEAHGSLDGPLGHAGLALFAGRENGLAMGLGVGLRRQPNGGGAGLTLAFLGKLPLITRGDWQLGLGFGAALADFEQSWSYDRPHHATEVVGFRWRRSTRVHLGASVSRRFASWALRLEVGAAHFFTEPDCVFRSEYANYTGACAAPAGSPPFDYGLAPRKTLPYASLALAPPIFEPSFGEHVGPTDEPVLPPRLGASWSSADARLPPRGQVSVGLTTIALPATVARYDVAATVSYALGRDLDLGAGGSAVPGSTALRVLGTAQARWRFLATKWLHLALMGTAVAMRESEIGYRFLGGGMLASGCLSHDCASLVTFQVKAGYERATTRGGAGEGRFALLAGPSVALSVLPHIAMLGEIEMDMTAPDRKGHAVLALRIFGPMLFVDGGVRLGPANVAPVGSLGFRWK